MCTSAFWRAASGWGASADWAVPTAMAVTDQRGRVLLANALASLVPARLAEAWIGHDPAWRAAWERPVNAVTDKALAALQAKALPSVRYLVTVYSGR